MAKNYIANEDVSLGHNVETASLSITNSPKDKNKAGPGVLGRKKVYAGNMSVSVSGAKQGTCASASGSVTINPTSTKAEHEGDKPIREGDSGTGTVNGTQTVSPFGACSFSITVDVDDAGQDKVRSE